MDTSLVSLLMYGLIISISHSNCSSFKLLGVPPPIYIVFSGSVIFKLEVHVLKPPNNHRLDVRYKKLYKSHNMHKFVHKKEYADIMN